MLIVIEFYNPQHENTSHIRKKKDAFCAREFVQCGEFKPTPPEEQ
jgi:hypothetical protein